MNTIFKDFNFSLIYAPAIIFQNVIVCSQAIELGCLNDLSINLTLTDLCLLNNLSVCYSNIFQQTSQTTSMIKSLDSPQMKPMKLSMHADQHDLSDSGFRSSICYADKSKAIDHATHQQKREMPYIWSFVGGHLSLRLYNDKEQLAQRIPLIHVKLMQPNMMTIVDSMEKVVHMSMFNLTIQLPDDQNADDSTVFDTHQGELDDDTGIPPALLELKKTICHAKNDTKIKCNIRRSVQMQLTPERVDKLLSLNELIQGIIYVKAAATPSTPSNVRPIVRYNSIRELSKLFGVANAIELNVLKVSAQFRTSMDRLLNIALYKWNSTIAVQKHPEQIAIGMACNSLVINTQNSMLLHPTSFRFDCNLSQEKWSKKLLIATNFTSNGVHFSIDPTDFWTFAKVQLDFWACFNRHFQWNDAEQNDDDGKLVDGGGGGATLHADHLTAYDLPKATGNNSPNNEEYFQDDLR